MLFSWEVRIWKFAFEVNLFEGSCTAKNSAILVNRLLSFSWVHVKVHSDAGCCV